MMKLTPEQQKIVEQNMPLVGKVIKDKIHYPSQLGIHSYEDICQIGYIGLCKAACTDKGGCFSTYAYRLIWHEICNSLIKSNRLIEREITVEPVHTAPLSEDTVLEDRQELRCVLSAVKQRSTDAIKKGIHALELAADGYNSQEIGAMMHAPSGTVRMWQTRARRFLQQVPEIKTTVRS